MTSKLVAYVAAGAASGMTAGAAVGALGSLIAEDARAGIGTVVAVVAAGYGVDELRARRWWLPQLDRETPQSWMDLGPIKWAVRNGIALGFGAHTRIGFALWFVVPSVAIVSGSASLGAAVWGTYGLCRTLAAGVIIGAYKRGIPPTAWLEYRNRARHVAAGAAVILGATTFVTIGL